MNFKKIALTLSILFIFHILIAAFAQGTNTIDRKKLVNRHNPTITKADAFSPFTVGNGSFAFTADITGLQTFPQFHQKGIPLGTLSDWGWHTIPPKTPFHLDETFRYHEVNGRQVPYAAQTNKPAGRWLRANPHRLHLGRIGFRSLQIKNQSLSIADLKDTSQTLNLWEGTINSTFRYNDQTFHVKTCCHPENDLIAVKIESSDGPIKNLAITFEFPYGSENWGPTMADWNSPNLHNTTVIRESNNHILLNRTLDNDKYFTHIRFSKNGSWSKQGPHTFQLTPQQGHSFEFVCEFSPHHKPADNLPNFSDTQNQCRKHWVRFWSSGGAIDLSESTDPRASELERRIVLSQYLTAIQCASSIPPQESGLTHNSWYGKFHLEMHWWHSVHFALWNRLPLLEKSLPWYKSILSQAQKTAKMQGYKGARWPKMIGPDGREGPSGVGVYLIWQQPHPIYYAELCYRANPTPKTLETYQDIVFESAEFMASYATWDKNKENYTLGPPLIPAQECYPPATTYNPTYELAYWSWGLQCAQQWRARLGLKPNKHWQHVIDHLSPLPKNNNLYVTTESTPDTFENTSLRRDHPSLVAALGILPDTEKVHRETMRQTLLKIFEDWNWESTWGWDYPMMAMTAARVREPELAIQSLLMDTPKNHFLPNGHCYQRENLPTYLPANGGLLTAVAMMAAGWDDAPNNNAPGFPKNGTWRVKYENLEKMP